MQIKCRTISLGSVIAAVAFTPQAHAQYVDAEAEAASSPETGQGEIIVTALRRSSLLQDAPASISAVDEATLVSAGIGSTNELARVLPSLRFEGGVRPGVPSIAARGISAVQGGDAPVSILVDGVQIPFLSFAQQDLLDVTSVELLRGPQGALYGRGAIAGALVINTRQPGDTVNINGRFTAQEGSDYKGVVTVSTPIAPGLISAKITASYHNRRGLLPYVSRGDYADFVDQGTLRGSVFITPSESTRLALFGTWIHGTVGTNTLAIVPATPGALEDFDTYQIRNNFRNYDQRRLWNVAAKLDQDFGFADLSIVAQYARARDYVVSDIDYTEAPVRFNFNPQLDEATNVDVRLTSKSDGPFSWLLGAFYQWRLGDNTLNIQTDPALGPPTLVLYSPDHNISKSYAGYGQVMYEAGNLSVSGALRYDIDKRTNELLNNPSSFVAGDFSAWQPSVTARYRFSPQLMAYATYGQGFRSGGFNAANLIGAGARRIYDKETSKNFEVGFKSTLIRGVTLNADVFYTKYANAQFQRTVLLGNAVARYVVSIPKSRAVGGEAELNARLTDDLQLTASVSITDTKITDFDGTQLYVGNPLPNAYHDNQQVSLNYTPRLTDKISGLFRIDAGRRGRISYHLQDVVNFGPVGFVDLKIGIETDRWSLSLFGKNITDRRAPEFVLANFNGSSHLRLANQPFHAGIEFTVAMDD